MKKIIDALNTKGIFHTVTAEGVEVLKQPANMDQKGKDMLQTFYGLSDFTVPKELKNPFENKASSLIEEMKKKALQEVKTKKA